jgi:DNA polymerase (family 10)
MSESEVRMSLPFARHLAEDMVSLLRPKCDRIEIAGSIRREKPSIGDVEIVMIPRLHTAFNLFGDSIVKRETDDITAALLVDGFTLLKNGDHFKQARLQGGSVVFDLFLTTPEQWGMIFTIRTGSADFSHRLVTQRNKGGLLPSYMHVKGGLLWAGDKVIPTPEERDVFNAIGLPWIEPSER